MQDKTRNPQNPEQAGPYTRGSFTFRRMQPWQIITMSVVAVVVLVLLIGAYYT